VAISPSVCFKVLSIGPRKYGGFGAEWDNKLLVYADDVSLAYWVKAFVLLLLLFLLFLLLPLGA
jgi:hypothetical protein